LTNITPKSADYRVFRERYRPVNIDVLWIAESPPAGGGYFYFEKASGQNPINLFGETMKALGWWPPGTMMHTGFDKSPYLRRFQESGHFLIDLSPKPVNKGLTNSERKAVLLSNVDRILQEIEQLDPKKLLLVKKNVFEILYPAIQNSKLKERLLNREFVHFPSDHWQPEFRDEVRRYLKIRS
jgi:hypothetical protein